MCDLSPGGALLAGEVPPPGTELHIVLLLPQREPVAVVGRVVRGAGEGALGVRFEGMRPDARQLIESVVRECLDRAAPGSVQGAPTAGLQHRPVALLCDSCGDEASDLAQTLVALGYRVIGVRTPLEAIVHLQNPGLEIDTVVLGSTLGQVGWVEMAAFLSDAYPQIRRVLVARTGRRRRGRARSLVHAVVRLPWTPDLLRAALH